MREVDDYVAFAFYWSKDSGGYPPSVEFYLPEGKIFEQRDEVLKRIEQPLRDMSFTHNDDLLDDSPDPSCHSVFLAKNQSSI